MKSPPAQGSPKTPALADADTSGLTFVGRTDKATVAVSNCQLERTMDGASNLTVTVHDPQLTFLNSPVLQRGKDGKLEETLVTIENQVFVVVGVFLKPSHMVEVALEDAAVYALRQNTKRLTMSRDTVTRAQFIKHMFAESGVELYCPELDKKQPIESTAEAEKKSEKDRKRKAGFSEHAKLTVKQKPADSEQRANIEAALEVAASDDSGEKAAVALLCAIIQESECRNLSYGSGSSTGILQLLATTAAGDNVDPRDVHAVCHLFLTKGFYGKGGAIALAKAHPTWNPGEIAQAVQGSEYPQAYGVWTAEATKMVGEYTPGGEALHPTKTYAKEYQFTRNTEPSSKGEGEDAEEGSWEAARRLAEEVGWYLFIEDGEGFFFSPEWLHESKVTDLLVAPGADGLIGLPEFGFTGSKRFDDTVTVNCYAAKWQAKPCTLVELEGYGPADGRWIVASILRENMKLSPTKITLGRPDKQLKEPAHELVTRSSSETTTTEGESGTALAAYSAAEALSALKIPYPPGDAGDTGHAPGEIGKEHPAFLDCSASTCYDLYRAGMFPSSTAQVSGELAESWGEAGEGKEMTVWANAKHVWTEFRVPGKPHSRLDTVPSEGEENGPRLRTTFPAPEGTATFTPRHWPGT